MESKHLQTIAHALVLVAVMLGLIAAALWFRLEPSAFQNEVQAQSTAKATADAGIPDAGKQRQLQLDLLQAVSQRLADIEKGLRDGSYSIQMVDPKGSSRKKESE
jgi:hypothetical protein